MAVAVFDYAAWLLRYPEFTGAVDETLAALFFAEAGLYLDNTDCSPVQDVTVRLMLLNMLTAHIAALSGAGSSDGKPGPVGRVESATEGSVTVSFDSGLSPGTAPWFAQTSYGLAFWQATKGYRSATYIPAPAYYTGTRLWPR